MWNGGMWNRHKQFQDSKKSCNPQGHGFYKRNCVFDLNKLRKIHFFTFLWFLNS